MEDHFAHLTRAELGDQFAAAVRLGGRPVTRCGDQLGYADLVLEAILGEFRNREMRERVAALASYESDCREGCVSLPLDDDDQLPF